jgi:hypothetical protein
MSIKLLEHIRDELRGSGAIQNTPEFCTGWLGRSESYIRTLRFRNRKISLCDRPSHCTANAACTTVLGGAAAPLIVICATETQPPAAVSLGVTAVNSCGSVALGDCLRLYPNWPAAWYCVK